ncbi:MAG: helix-turn-helix domain-containing protein [Saprospiraceae bacterium]
MNNEITNPANLVLIIIGLFLGLTLGIFLLFNNSAKNRANIYLGLLVLLSVTYFGQGFVFRFDLLERFPHVIGTSKLINFLIGPLTYLYVRACTQKGFEMKPILWLHFLPFVLDLIYLSPFFMQSGAEKINYFLTMVQIGDVQASKLEIMLKSIHAIIYFGFSFQLISQYNKHLKNSTSSIDYAFHSWVLVFIAIHTIPTLALIIGFGIFPIYGTYTLVGVLLSFFIFSIAVFIAILVKPELFHNFPHQIPIPQSTEEKKQKYESSNLQEQQKESYLKKLVQFVELNKPYLETELTLAQLSEQINIPSHYLSQVINEKLKCNFLDFINGYRIEEAKEKLADIKFNHYTIVAVAFESGFNSKSAFYSAFKKQVGATPSSYRKSLAS